MLAAMQPIIYVRQIDDSYGRAVDQIDADYLLDRLFNVVHDNNYGQ